jgi:hypothetical protein
MEVKMAEKKTQNQDNILRGKLLSNPKPSIFGVSAVMIGADGEINRERLYSIESALPGVYQSPTLAEKNKKYFAWMLSGKALD